MGILSERVCDDDEEVIGERDAETERESDGGFLTLGGDTQRNGHQSEGKARQRGGEALVELDFGGERRAIRSLGNECLELGERLSALSRGRPSTGASSALHPRAQHTRQRERGAAAGAIG